MAMTSVMMSVVSARKQKRHKLTMKELSLFTRILEELNKILLAVGARGTVA
jgi:hypothetical protein